MASIRGKVALVTGATDGLGRALAAELARAGATVLVHGGDTDRLADTVRETGAVRSYQADLASLAEVRALAGHSSIRVTNRYVHATGTDLRGAMDRGFTPS